MKDAYRPLRIVTLIAIIVFTIVSAFGCFAIMGRYIVNQGSGDFIFAHAGDTFLEETRSNSFPIILILSISQICLLWNEKQQKRLVSTLLAVIAFLVTVLYKPLCDGSEQIMGGIVSYYCIITWLGYIAIGLSMVVLLLQAFLLKKPR